MDNFVKALYDFINKFIETIKNLVKNFRDWNDDN